MLSRTADHLFWMSRYIERAENLARLLDVTWQMSLVPQSLDAANQNWNAIIALNSLETAYAEHYDTVNAENVLRFMVTDPNNYSSIYSCLRLARENAHAVRGTVTSEMWETLNSTWLEAREKSFEQILNAGIGEFFDWVKMRSSLSRGVTIGTLLQDEAFHFIRLGTLLERADNTARILDIKYHVLRPHGDEGATDFYQWGALLRSVSAFEVYRKVYRDVITPERVTELLILRNDMPRSLHFCMNGVVKNLELIANSHSGETQRQAGLLHAQLHYARVEDILAEGLHKWLTDFMDRIYALGDGISKDFLVPMAEAA
ncbi:alpha-E domain-containing protein [Dechloromonas denitrificans]|uniref:alpha-E domain-containing protein n=1 Tax=Dechloromonas denitrificans TaxID=281362 RepID=UPI001CF882AC|nr:alpha-E domain-containing protein [Dechloromonas denitrificans]UCV12595.1 alpha-E domain-containing protein [Dechloromonas denitrificans]